MKQANEEIRREVIRSGIRMYELAETMCLSPSSLSIRLRKELSDEDKEKIISAIETTRKRIWGDMT